MSIFNADETFISCYSLETFGCLNKQKQTVAKRSKLCIVLNIVNKVKTLKVLDSVFSLLFSFSPSFKFSSCLGVAIK